MSRIASGAERVRQRMAQGYTEGDRLLLQYANNASSDIGKRHFQARASLHWIINDALTDFGTKRLRDVLEDFNNQQPNLLFTPTIELQLPRHDQEGNAVIDPNTNQQRSHLIALRLPVRFIVNQLALRRDGAGDAQMLRANVEPHHPMPDDQRIALTRLVARRMSVRRDYFPGENWDHEPVPNWLASERAVNEALNGGSYALPPEK